MSDDPDTFDIKEEYQHQQANVGSLELADMLLTIKLRSIGEPGRKAEITAKEEQDTRRNIPSNPVLSIPTLFLR